MKLALTDGKMTLSVNNPDSGSATEELGVDYAADAIEIGFNSRYLLDVAGQLETGTAEFRFADPGSPTLILDDGADGRALRPDADAGVSAFSPAQERRRPTRSSAPSRRTPGSSADGYDVVAFGDDAKMADELLELVLAGIKRATASLGGNFGEGRQPLPAVGDYVVLVDGRNKPRCVWRTTDVTVKPSQRCRRRLRLGRGRPNPRRLARRVSARQRRGLWTTPRWFSSASPSSGRASSPTAGRDRGCSNRAAPGRPILTPALRSGDKINQNIPR